jgi:hypothetical protein
MGIISYMLDQENNSTDMSTSLHFSCFVWFNESVSAEKWQDNSEGWVGKAVEGNSLACEEFCLQRWYLAPLIGSNRVGSLPKDEDRV